MSNELRDWLRLTQELVPFEGGRPRLAQLKLTANLSANTGMHEHLTFNQGVVGSNPTRLKTPRFCS